MKRSLLLSYTLLVVSFITIFIGSCKKDDENIIVSGTVVDPQNGNPISGANVYLDGKILSSGIYNESYSEIASAITDASGHFEITTAWQVVSSYRLRAFKRNYFDSQTIVAAESISKGATYSTSLSLFPASWVRLNINNVVGYADDEIQYKFTSTPQSCADCCSNSFLIGSGNYHTAYKCRAVGNRYNKFYWTVRKNGVTNPFTDSVYCVAFDTATININY